MKIKIIINEIKMAKSVLEEQEKKCGYNHLGIKTLMWNSIKWLEELIESKK